ncbi:unnamed protein product [Discosporangium mesarthrocarpum]
MPSKGWFRYVSSPHYLAELLVYLSYLTMCGRGAEGGVGLMVLWVLANQAVVAASTHEWYRKKFDDYPPERKRLIPFLW